MLLRFSKSGKQTDSDGFVKKSADSDSVSDSRQRHYKLIYCTPAVEHSARPLVGGKCGDDAQLRQSFVAGTDATQPQANWGQFTRGTWPCAHNNAEAIIILDGRQRIRLVSHTAALATTHSYATSIERRHLISKY